MLLIVIVILLMLVCYKTPQHYFQYFMYIWYINIGIFICYCIRQCLSCYQAVNETQIDTFGTQLVKNHIGDSVYTHCQNHHCQHKNSYFGLGLSDCPQF